MTAKRFILVDDYKIGYDGDIFDLHKPSNIRSLVNVIGYVTDENEQLKTQLRDYHNAFDCSQCKYQNYDWYNEGDEFEVCDKGNNEAQMEYHSCKDWEEL